MSEAMASREMREIPRSPVHEPRCTSSMQGLEAVIRLQRRQTNGTGYAPLGAHLRADAGMATVRLDRVSPCRGGHRHGRQTQLGHVEEGPGRDERFAGSHGLVTAGRSAIGRRIQRLARRGGWIVGRTERKLGDGRLDRAAGSVGSIDAVGPVRSVGPDESVGAVGAEWRNPRRRISWRRSRRQRLAAGRDACAIGLRRAGRRRESHGTEWPEWSQRHVGLAERHQVVGQVRLGRRQQHVTLSTQPRPKRRAPDGAPFVVSRP